MELCSACKKSLSFGINGKCASCGRDMPISHHEGYAYSISVRWLCLACHSTWHRENGEGLNGK